MIKVIFDGGATSTKVAIIRDKTLTYNALDGFNPQHGDWLSFQSQLTVFFNALSNRPESIRYYGAGMSTPILIQQMKSCLQQSSGLYADEITVDSDLMACCHAVYRDQPVITGILGTGSNIGYFDGNAITRQTPSLGYLMGDEGSGVDIGRRILQAYFYHRLPEQVMDDLQDNYEITYDNFLENTYVTNNFRAFASTLAPIATKYASDDIMNQIIVASLTDFVKNRMMAECLAYPDVSEVYMFGSISSVFEAHLTTAMESCGLQHSLYTASNALEVMINRHVD